jgi:hypothetical protein
VLHNGRDAEKAAVLADPNPSEVHRLVGLGGAAALLSKRAQQPTMP